jgi:hypothetical protein
MYFFNVDLSNPSNNNFDLQTYINYNYIIELYQYFLDTDITTDGDFELTSDYFNNKMNFLYYEFFGDSAVEYDPTKRPINPNGNKIILSTLNIKVAQFYLYFFENDLSIKLGFSIFQ